MSSGLGSPLCATFSRHARTVDEVDMAPLGLRGASLWAGLVCGPLGAPLVVLAPSSWSNFQSLAAGGAGVVLIRLCNCLLDSALCRPLPSLLTSPTAPPHPLLQMPDPIGGRTL